MTQLVTLAEGVHTLETTLRIHAGFYLPVRSTLLRLDDGSLLMISPLRIDDALAARVDALGPISHIVAPSNPVSYTHLRRTTILPPERATRATWCSCARVPRVPVMAPRGRMPSRVSSLP